VPGGDRSAHVRGRRGRAHPDAAADALVDQLAGQQVRHVAAVLLGRQRHLRTTEGARRHWPQAGRTWRAALQPRPLLSGCSVVSGSMRAAVGLRAGCCVALRRQRARPVVAAVQRAPLPPPPLRAASVSALPPRLSQRRAAAAPPLRARGSSGGEPPPSDGDLTPLLVTYGGGAPPRLPRSQPAQATHAESLAVWRVFAGVLGTALVAGIAYFGADAWLNNDDIFYGTAAGLSPGCVTCSRAWLD
jgi:hypothetical protein